MKVTGMISMGSAAILLLRSSVWIISDAIRDVPVDYGERSIQLIGVMVLWIIGCHQFFATPPNPTQEPAQPDEK